MRAERNSPLEVTLTVQKIVMKDGEERRIDATDAAPGDVLEYRTEYKNVGKTALTKVTAVLPLPEHTSFIRGSAHPSDVEASTRADQNRFTPAPGADAADAPADSYAALRWSIERLAPGQQASVGARVRVDRLKPVTVEPPPAAHSVQDADARKNLH
ncbi:MAG: hypothetical protein JWP38_1460 [Herbaspirillum sp.]|nr:hypothetical protein [Herbaspirillum sp.]